MDMLSAAYNGLCYIMYGNDDGSLNDTITLKDKTGAPVNLGQYVINVNNRPKTILKGDNRLWGHFVKAHDWDDDGDLDLLMSARGTAWGPKGDIGYKKITGMGVKLRINEGSNTNPVFGTENIDVVPAHYADALVDWDGDGLWDIVGGSLMGGVYFYKNLGKPGNPKFGEAKCLIEPSEFEDKDKGGQCGITQLTVSDYNNDGKLDLIIGNNNLIYKEVPDYTAEEIKEREQIQKLQAECQYMGKVIRDKYRIKYKGNVEKVNKAMMKDKDYLKIRKRWKEFSKKSARLKELTPEVIPYGFIWVSLRE